MSHHIACLSLVPGRSRVVCRISASLSWEYKSLPRSSSSLIYCSTLPSSNQARKPDQQRLNMANYLRSYLLLALLVAVWSMAVNSEEDDPTLDRTIRSLKQQLLRQHLTGRADDSVPIPGRQRRFAIGIPRMLWPGAVVTYAFYKDPTYGLFTQTHIKTIRRALGYISATTCVKFREVPQQEVIDRPRGKLMIAGGTTGSACQSEVGMGNHNPYQILYLTLGCLGEFGGNRITHEVMHALGFFHEHTRPDRDQYIRINAENIWVRALGLFRIERFPSTLLNTEYDYESVQHYSDFQYLGPGKPYGSATFTPLRNTSVQIGQRYAMSVMDIFRINRLYSCPAVHAPAKDLSCHSCIRHLHVVANISVDSGSSVGALRLVMVVNDDGTFRTENHILNLTLADVKSGVHIWRVHPKEDCMRPEDIQVSALRATSKDALMIRSAYVIAKFGRETRYLSSIAEPDVKMTLRTTEIEAQRLLQPVSQPSCNLCQTGCISQIDILLKFNTDIQLLNHTEAGLNMVDDQSRRWTLTSLLSSDSRNLAKRVHHFTGTVAGCVTAKSLVALAVVQGRFARHRRFPPGLQMVVVTAKLGSEQQVVLADRSFSAAWQKFGLNLIIQATQTCAPNCQACV